MSSDEKDRARENAALVRRVVEVFQAGDFEQIFALAHPDFEVFVPASLANAGRYRGRDGFLTWLEQWLEAWEGFTVQIDDVEPVGEHHVVANMHQSAQGKGSGVAVEMNISYLWDIREGRLAAMHLYATREEALRAAEQRERSTGD
jgi:ketosteroid isomerase-like protein